MDRKIVITLSRQYCSGGLKVGKRLAEELGISCYDSEMFRLVSDNKAMTDNEVAHDARIKDTLLFDVAKKTYEERPSDELAEADEILFMRNLFSYQSEIIRGLAEKESCVIVGRCADYILRDRPDTIRVFVHAPMDFRIRRASSIHNLPESELASYIRSVDERKASYYHNYTGGNWQDAENYDLSLDTSKMGIRGCAEMIQKYIEIRFPVTGQ
ncbi:MAG: cytidylate kinase-like family protein [Eubacterium sp.]|nr:cytidylate kinase-like family protein [Eubacterium sp.]